MTGNMLASLAASLARYAPRLDTQYAAGLINPGDYLAVVARVEEARSTCETMLASHEQVGPPPVQAALPASSEPLSHPAAPSGPMSQFPVATSAPSAPSGPPMAMSAPSAPSRPMSPVPHPTSPQALPLLNPDPETRLQRKRPFSPWDESQSDGDSQSDDQSDAQSEEEDELQADTDSLLDEAPAEKPPDPPTNESLLLGGESFVNQDQVTDGHVDADKELEEEATPPSPLVIPWEIPDAQVDAETDEGLEEEDAPTNSPLVIPWELPDALTDMPPLPGQSFASQLEPTQQPTQHGQDPDFAGLFQQATQGLADPAADLDTDATQPFGDEPPSIFSGPDPKPTRKKQRACEHGRTRRSDCKYCVGACPHDRLPRKCKICHNSNKKSPKSSRQAEPSKPRTAPRDKRADAHAAEFFAKLGQEERLREASRLVDMCLD
jgi:hypothetical protein